jgi:hypothetical protein
VVEMQHEVVVRDNMGNRICVTEFMERAGEALYDNEYGRDINPKTRPLSEDKVCENCKQEKKCRLCSGCHRVEYCGTECQHADWPNHRDNCQLCCEVIFTFEDYGQDIYNVYMKHTVDEKTFVRIILDTIPLHSHNFHDLKHLTKLSTATSKGFLTFRKKNNGKYFFNNDLSTKKWQKFLKEYISQRVQ